MTRPLLSSSALFLFFVIPACSQDAASSKQPLAVCQEGEEGCPSVQRAEKQPSSSKSNTPSGDPSTPTSTNEEELKGATPDAGPPPADAAADAALGALCTALSKCCDQIEEAGYVSDNCKSVVALKHEGACYAQHEQYKNAGDCS